MDIKLLGKLLWTIYYAEIAVWTMLAALLVISAVLRKRILIYKTIKYLINSVTLLAANLFYLSQVTVVRPSIQATKEQSVKFLSHQVCQHVLQYVYCAAIILSILVVVNWIFGWKMEKTRSRNEFWILMTIDGLILGLGIFLAAQSEYQGLLIEINRHFANWR